MSATKEEIKSSVFPLRRELPPRGERGQSPLPVEINADCVNAINPTGEQVQGAYLDWWNDRLQILCYDGVCDEVAVYVRFNPDGTIAEVMLREDLRGKAVIESPEASAWTKERDGSA